MALRGVLPADIADLEIDATAPLQSAWEPDTLDGVTVIRGRGWEVDTSAWRHRLYRPLGSAPAAARQAVALNAVPHYARANREPGAMRVWIPFAVEIAQAPPDQGGEVLAAAPRV